MVSKKVIIVTTVGVIAVAVAAFIFLKPMKPQDAVAVIKAKAPNAQYQPGVMTDGFLVAWAKALNAGLSRFIYNTIVYTSSNGLPYRP